MAFLFAHIISQIRHGFRSRIFFELKILFSCYSTPDTMGYDALRCHQLSPWQHPISSLFVVRRVENSVFSTLPILRIKILIKNQQHQTRTIFNPCH